MPLKLESFNLLYFAPLERLGTVEELIDGEIIESCSMVVLQFKKSEYIAKSGQLCVFLEHCLSGTLSPNSSDKSDSDITLGSATIVSAYSSRSKQERAADLTLFDNPEPSRMYFEGGKQVVAGDGVPSIGISVTWFLVRCIYWVFILKRSLG